MMCSAIAIEAVAAGDGALRIEVTGPTRLIRKSSTSAAVGVDRLGAYPGGSARHVGERDPGQVRPGLGEVGAP